MLSISRPAFIAPTSVTTNSVVTCGKHMAGMMSSHTFIFIYLPGLCKVSQRKLEISKLEIDMSSTIALHSKVVQLAVMNVNVWFR